MTELYIWENEVLKCKIQERDGEIYELQRQIEVLHKKLAEAETKINNMQNSMCGNMEMGK